MEKNSKSKKENITKSKFPLKIFKFLFFSYIIVFVVWLIVGNMLGGEKDIYEKIGVMEPYSISTKDALNIKSYAIMPYANYLSSGDSTSAYAMLTDEYKSVMSYDNFIKSIEGIDFNSFDMKQIKMKAEGTYVATVVYDRDGKEEETEYLLFLNEVNPQIITISPDKFIYSFSDMRFKKDGVDVQVQSCKVYTDSINMVFSLKNTSMFETMTFKNVGLGYGENINKPHEIDIVLKPGESKEIEINYDTNYYLPNNIKVKRLIDEETLRTYTFYFENAK